MSDKQEGQRKGFPVTRSLLAPAVGFAFQGFLWVHRATHPSYSERDVQAAGICGVGRKHAPLVLARARGPLYPQTTCQPCLLSGFMLTPLGALGPAGTSSTGSFRRVPADRWGPSPNRPLFSASQATQAKASNHRSWRSYGAAIQPKPSQHRAPLPLPLPVHASGHVSRLQGKAHRQVYHTRAVAAALGRGRQSASNLHLPAACTV